MRVDMQHCTVFKVPSAKLPDGVIKLLRANSYRWTLLMRPPHCRVRTRTSRERTNRDTVSVKIAMARYAKLRNWDGRRWVT